MFNPSGAPNATRASVRVKLSTRIANFNIVKMITGMIINLNNDAHYTFLFESISRIFYPPITKPARSIATGPMQFEAFVSALIKKLGIY